MLIRCLQCGANNHPRNVSCLTCGADLSLSRQPAPVAAVAATVTEPELSAVEVPVENPSSQLETEESNKLAEEVRYLFQTEADGSQEPRGSRAGLYLLLVLFTLAIAAAGWQWRELRKSAVRMQRAPAVASDASAAPVSPAPASNPEGLPRNALPPLSQPTHEEIATNVPSDTSEQSAKPRIEPASSTTRLSTDPETEGEKYLYGDGVPVDCDRAQKNLLAAAKHSSAKAASDLATMYATGHCAIRDLPLAYRWLSRAQKQEPGNKKVASEMQTLWNQMSIVEKNLATR